MGPYVGQILLQYVIAEEVQHTLSTIKWHVLTSELMLNLALRLPFISYNEFFIT